MDAQPPPMMATRMGRVGGTAGPFVLRPRGLVVAASSIAFEYPGRETLDEALVVGVGQRAIDRLELRERGTCQSVRDLSRIIDAVVFLHPLADPEDIVAVALTPRS